MGLACLYKPTLHRVAPPWKHKQADSNAVDDWLETGGDRLGGSFCSQGLVGLGVHDGGEGDGRHMY